MVPFSMTKWGRNLCKWDPDLLSNLILGFQGDFSHLLFMFLPSNTTIGYCWNYLERQSKRKSNIYHKIILFTMNGLRE